MRLLPVSLLLAASLIVGCSTTEEAASDGDRRSAAVERQDDGLAGDASSVRTVQLYAGSQETALPLLDIAQTGSLTLEFDMMGERGRPVSVYFYHADRDWRRNLVPAEYMESFFRDDVLDYRISANTEVKYAHYRYSFPNGSIRFKISGNYILRVTEQGMEDQVLFERPFYVTEQEVPIGFALDNILVAGQAYPSLQPVVRFTPPQTASLDAFDYSVCFVRNGRFEQSRCTDRPSLALQPDLEFFLQPEASFLPDPPEFLVDVSEIRIGGRIEETNLQENPFQVLLEPDYQRFPGTLNAQSQNGQAVIDRAVRGVGNPDTDADYAEVFFRLAPVDDAPIDGRVFLVGAFNDWRLTESEELVWDPATQEYGASVLLKQGRYEYRYVYTDPREAREAIGASPQFQNLVTALVYVEDVRLGTDRLISAASVVGG